MAPHASPDLHEVFAPAERACASCGARALTAGRFCPACGVPYVSRRGKPFGTRRRQLILAAAVLTAAAAIAAGVAILTPGIERAKRGHAAAQRRAAAAARAALIARATAEQQLQRASGRDRDPGPSAPQAARLAARSALLRELEAAITADARARARAGIFTGPIQFTTCSPYPADTRAAQTNLAEQVGPYACLAVNRPVKGPTGTVAELGDPFWARIDFARSRFAWCKINPRPGEQAVDAAAVNVPLAQACDLNRPAPVPLG